MATGVERADPISDYLRRQRRLRQKLLSATEAFEQFPDHRRQAVLVALGFIQDFLMDIYGPSDPKPLVTLRQLIYALYDLDLGATSPLLTPKKISHRSLDSLAKKSFRAFAAAAMELLVKAKVKRVEAARRVANALNQRGYRGVRNRRITANDVENWRDQLRVGSPVEDQAVARFRRLIDSAATSTDPSLDAMKILEDLIPGVVPPQIPKKAPS